MAYRVFSILMTIILLATQSVFGSESIDSIAPPPCVAPSMPANGSNYWNVLAYDGYNKLTAADYKGYYQAVDEHEPISFIKNGVTVYSFKFKPTLDGWSTLQSPSDALASKGAKADYVGCPVSVDNFSIRAKRKGFPCGYYGVAIKNLQQGDGFSLKLDSEGDGVFEEIETCNSCNVSSIYPLGGFLGPKSIVEFDAFDSNDSFNIELIFEYVLPVSFAFAEKSTICLGESTKIYIGGSEKYTWTPATVPEDPTGFNKTVIATPSVTTNYRAISNVAGCSDTVFINIKVIPKDTFRRDSVSCNVLNTSTLTYNFKNINGCDSVVMITVKPLRKDTIYLPFQFKCNPSDTAAKTTKLTNIGGCDSLVIQRFKLSAADTVLRDSFICKPLTVNTLTYKFKNNSGCDSVEIVTLKLLKQDTTILQILSRCNPSDTATKVLTLKNISGCDSLVIQRFKLSAVDTILRDSFICKPLTVNTLTYKFKNNSGCDSIVIVTLKLLKHDTTLLPILSRCNPSDTATKVLTL